MREWVVGAMNTASGAATSAAKKAYLCATPRSVGTLQVPSPFTGAGDDLAMVHYTLEGPVISTGRALLKYPAVTLPWPVTI